MAIQRICSVTGCSKKHLARGYCTLHYQRWSHGRAMDAPPHEKGLYAICTVDGCGRPHTSKGLCSLHWQRRKHGTAFSASIKTPNGTVAEFVRLLLTADTDDCIEWPFAKNPGGYGVYTSSPGSPIASRYLCEMRHGSPPEPSYHAAHSCGNGHKGCVNPKHLRWATPQENVDDKRLHGTQLEGEEIYRAILTVAEVVEIKRQLAKGATQASLADFYGVTDGAISSIARGVNWKSVPWPDKEKRRG